MTEQAADAKPKKAKAPKAPKEPKRVLVDTMARRIVERRKRRAEEAAANADEDSPRKKGRAEYRQEEHRAQGERHQQQMGRQIYQRKGVVDPSAAWGCNVPRAFVGVNTHILQAAIKRGLFEKHAMDTETFQFWVGAIGVGGIKDFKNKVFGAEDLDTVTLFSEYSELADYIRNAAVRGIQHVESTGEKAVIKIWGHYAAKFDWSGLALHLGIDRNINLEDEVFVPGEKKGRKITWSISSFSGKSRITVNHGNGKVKIELVDSTWLMPAPLRDLGAALSKGILPEKYEDPIKWLNEQKWMKDKGYTITFEEVRYYLLNAHLAPLSDFKGILKDHVYEALEYWKSNKDGNTYLQSDVAVLSNALMSFDETLREIIEPLRDVLGDELINQFDPLGYNTTATAGFAVSMAYWYASRLQRTPAGDFELRDSLKRQAQKTIIALCPAGGGTPYLLTEAEAYEVKKSNETLQKHGLILTDRDTYIENPIIQNKIDNQFFSWVQFGGRNEVFANWNLPGTRVMAIDANSMYPSVQMAGVSYRIPELANRRLNALLGYVDPSFIGHLPTKPMKEAGIATQEVVVNEDGLEVLAWVVRGRLNILNMLMFRGGMFMADLPPSKEPFLHTYPAVPFRVQGKDLDSRMIYPAIKEKTLCRLAGETLGFYASFPTENDDDMVVYLCREGINEKGELDMLPLSRHGAIMGINPILKEKDGQIYVDVSGQQPFMPHAEFVGKTYKIRRKYQMAALQAAAAGDKETAKALTAKATMVKLILNGGGYGTYAQGKQPEIDIDLSDMEQVISCMKSLAAMDPAWDGLAEFVFALQSQIPEVEAADYAIAEGERVGWPHLYRRLQRLKAMQDDLLDAIGRSPSAEVSAQIEDDLSKMRREHSRVPDELFQVWSAAHIVAYSTYSYHEPRRFREDKKIPIKHGLISLAEETAVHAIRSIAVGITAKAQVSLLIAIRAVHEAGYQLMYCDTDSVHFAVPWSTEPGVSEEDIVKAKLEETSLIKLGDDLLQWKFEDKKIQRGLGLPHQVENGETLKVWNSCYLGAKVYFLMGDVSGEGHGYDNGANRVRSVPGNDPIGQAVGKGCQFRAPDLASRPGLQSELFRYVNLFSDTKITFGDSYDAKTKGVESLFANPRRQHDDMYSSRPFEVRLPEEIRTRIAANEQLSPDYVSRAINRQISIDYEFKAIKGMKDAYSRYIKNVRIAGKSFDKQSEYMDEKISKLRKISMGGMDLAIEETQLYNEAMLEEYAEQFLANHF